MVTPKYNEDAMRWTGAQNTQPYSSETNSMQLQLTKETEDEKQWTIWNYRTYQNMAFWYGIDVRLAEGRIVEAKSAK